MTDNSTKELFKGIIKVSQEAAIEVFDSQKDDLTISSKSLHLWLVKQETFKLLKHLIEIYDYTINDIIDELVNTLTLVLLHLKIEDEENYKSFLDFLNDDDNTLKSKEEEYVKFLILFDKSIDMVMIGEEKKINPMYLLEAIYSLLKSIPDDEDEEEMQDVAKEDDEETQED